MVESDRQLNYPAYELRFSKFCAFGWSEEDKMFLKSEVTFKPGLKQLHTRLPMQTNLCSLFKQND